MSDPDDRGRVVSDEERARALLEQLKSVHALDIGRDMVIAAVNFSYPKLGLSDETKAVRDLGDVRLSIELIRAILEVLDREDGGKTGDLHDTLAQMQLAYAHAVQLDNAERAAAHEAEPAAPATDEAPAEAAAEAPATEEAPASGADEPPAEEPPAPAERSRRRRSRRRGGSPR